LRDESAELTHREDEAAESQPDLVAEPGREDALVVERLEPEVVDVQPHQGVEDDQDQEDEGGHVEDPARPPADPKVAEVRPSRPAAAKQGLDVVEEIAAATELHQTTLSNNTGGRLSSCTG